MFLTIQQGEYTINIHMISEIEWVDEEEATITMATGTEYTVEGDDFHSLKKAVGR